MIKKLAYTDHNEWLSLRHKYIGGSDAAAVVGMNPYKSAFNLWAEKTDQIKPFEGNLATEVGAFLEDFVAQKFEQATGKKVRKVNKSFVNDDYPFAIANIDREIVGENAGLEIKTTSEVNIKKFKNGEYPAQYYVQCMHYLAVTGKQKWYLAVLVGNREFLIFTIDRDDDEIAALMNAERDFWQLVENCTPPAVDGTSSTTNAINEMYQDSDDESVDLSPLIKTLHEYTVLKTQIESLKALQDEKVNLIKEEMKTAEKGKCSSYNISWKTQTRKSFDAERFLNENYDVLSQNDILLNDYYKTSESRVFRITERR